MFGRTPHGSAFRPVAGVAVGIAVALALAACSKPTSGTGGLAGDVVSPTGVASSSATVGAPSSGSTPVPTVTVTNTSGGSGGGGGTPAYPDDYFTAILSAYGSHDTAYLTLLTSASTANQMFGWGNINKVWHLVQSEGAAGSSYGSFYNNAGDWLVLRYDNAKVSAHQWHAGTVFTWDQMTFPSDASTYVKHFVDAWINGNKARMSLLGSTPLMQLFTVLLHKPDLNGYTITTNGAAGSTYVTISEPSAFVNIVVQVTNQTLGGQHAIASCYSGCS